MKTNAKALHAQARIGDRIIAHKIKQETARGSRPKLKTFAARVNCTCSDHDGPVVDNAEQRPSGRAKAVAHRHHEDEHDSSPLYRPGGTEGPILPTSDDEAQMMTPPSTRDFIKRRGGK